MSGIRSCTVFIGNIPYDASEDDLKELFGRVGTIDSLRLVYDKDTKQPRGYAFCDYADPDTAVKAIKELSAVECNGRALRIDLADNALRGSRMGALGAGAPPLALTAPPSFPAVSRPSVPPSFPSVPAAPPPGPAPVGMPISAGVVPARPVGLPGAPATPAHSTSGSSPEDVIAEVMAHNDIAQTVAAMPQAQLQLCLGTMQRLVTEAPEHARAFLQDNPQLCYALLHGQLLLGLTLDAPLPPSEEEIQRLRAESLKRFAQLSVPSAVPPPPRFPQFFPAMVAQPGQAMPFSGAAVGLAPKASPMQPTNGSVPTAC